MRKSPVNLPALTLLALTSFATAEETAPEITQLANEVRTKGWIASSARSAAGDWDLFLMRPNSSERRNITNSPNTNECYPLFSRDGSRLLFRRLPKSENIEANRHGEQGVPIVAKANGTDPKELGKEGDLPWASWSPDGKQFACLSLKGISFVDAETGKTLRTLKRNGFFQQLTWSPDGRWLSGVSNAFGASWTAARMNAETGEANVVSNQDNCTPDWFPDSKRMIFSNRHASDVSLGKTGWTQLWMADAEGQNLQLVYAEDGRHIYGGHISPDGNYILFTGNPQEDGDPANGGAPMALMRVADAPILGKEAPALRKLHPNAKTGPVLPLPAGWEPCWTAAEISFTK